MQQRMPWALGYGFVLLIWLTSRFLLLPAGEISAEFTTLLILTTLMVLPLPWVRIPPELTIPYIGGGVLLGMIMLQLSIRGRLPTVLAFMQALVIVFVAILPLIWSRITGFMTFLLLTGACMINVDGQMLLWRGGVLWFLGGMLALLLTLSYSSRYIAPPFNQEQNQTSFLSFRLLLLNLFSDLERKKRRTRHVATVARSFSEIKAGSVPSHQAYAIYKGPRYHGAVGPGYTFLSPNARINEVYDVRPQLHIGTINATTRDGIRIDSEAHITFCVRRPEGPPDPHFPFRYDRRAIGRLKPTMIAKSDGTEGAIHPFQQVAPQGTMVIADEISRRTLNQLMEVTVVEGQTSSALTTVEEIAKEKLNIFFRDRGLTIDHIELLPFRLPQNVLDARLGAWKKQWQTRVGKRRIGKSIKKVSPEAVEAELSVIRDMIDSLKVYREIGNAQLSEDLPGYDQIMRQIEQVILNATAEGVMSSLLPKKKNG